MSARPANNFDAILRAFLKCDVNFMIAGGYAVIFHGYGRSTGDLDLWVEPAEENKKKIMAAFMTLKMPAELLEHINGLDFLRPFAVKIGKQPLQLDVFNAITGVRYEEALKRSVSYQFYGRIRVRFIHLHDLIANKMLTGRLQDKADVDMLQKINRLKPKT